MEQALPKIEKMNQTHCLIVDGKPLFLRAGEVCNSTASDLCYMERAWDAAKAMHLNALVVPVYWECVEPTEGYYDYSLLDGIIQRARETGIHLVLLWFGLWKNGSSDYVPGWVKQDGTRFWRIRTKEGSLPVFREKRNLTISPFCEEAVTADQTCFAALMRHLREVDAYEQTVLMVQVENEVGVLGLDRDYSEAAQKAFAAPVPQFLCEKLGIQNGSWRQCFGESAGDAFMAWQYAQAVNHIASTGKKEYPVPMYCNAWLRQPPRMPGEYPSGGPQPHNQEIWRAGAPAIDFYAPDIYLPEFSEICNAYREKGNPLCIPEARRTADSISYYLYALGEYGAICFSPFGVERMLEREEEMDPVTLRLLDISEEAFRAGPLAGERLSQVYGYTAEMEAILAEAIPAGKTHGFLDNGQLGINMPLSGCLLRILYQKNRKPGDPVAGGLVLEMNEHEFVILAVNCTFTVEGNGESLIEVERYEEGIFVQNEWKRGRILNGDERAHIRFSGKPKMIRCKLFKIN